MNLIKQNLLGLVGLMILCAGIVLPQGIAQNFCNVVGISALIVYAFLGKNDFFFYLEIVVLIGTIMKIFNVETTLMFAVLIIATIISFAIIFRNPIYRSWDIIFGVVGISGLIYGYATLSNYGYAIGGLATIVYSLIGFSKGIKSALVFALLNTIYSALAIYMIISH
ncbi:MAG: hypothetical protein EKK64_06460 [Neisseriaceae bacterium]|nr:MAG: hypothetical protein EKK64_06460 [Neisseriaceae bacterium]